MNIDWLKLVENLSAFFSYLALLVLGFYYLFRRVIEGQAEREDQRFGRMAELLDHTLEKQWQNYTALLKEIKLLSDSQFDLTEKLTENQKILTQLSGAVAELIGLTKEEIGQIALLVSQCPICSEVKHDRRNG